MAQWHLALSVKSSSSLCHKGQSEELFFLRKSVVFWMLSQTSRYFSMALKFKSFARHVEMNRLSLCLERWKQEDTNKMLRVRLPQATTVDLIQHFSRLFWQCFSPTTRWAQSGPMDSISSDKNQQRSGSRWCIWVVFNILTYITKPAFEVDTGAALNIHIFFLRACV